MKFVYVDESGNADQGDIFVMAGLLIDAYRLPKYTKLFDKQFSDFFEKYPNKPKELKTKSFIAGKDKWNLVKSEERKNFLLNLCKLAAEVLNIYAVAISFHKFSCNKTKEEYCLPNLKDHWSFCAMFIASLIQKKMQKIKQNKGLSVLIFDDNKSHIPELSDSLYNPNSWFENLYQNISSKGIKKKPINRESNNFSCIINTAFAIKSEHSSLVQVADVVSYVYRRNLELNFADESYLGEKEFYKSLVTILDKERVFMRKIQKSRCADFYNAIKHPDWIL